MATLQDPAAPPPAYWPPLPQPGLRIAFDLPASLRVDWPAIDDALLPRIGAGEIVVPTLAPDVPADLDAIALARRILTIAGVLLRSQRYPSFAPGHVLSATEAPADPAMLRVWIRVPCFEQLPADVFRRAYRHAREVALTAVRAGVAPAGTAFERAHADLAEHGSAMPGGASTVPILKAAHTLGIPQRHLGAGIYLLGHGSAGRKFERSSIALDSALGAKISGDKAMNNALLRLAGLPVPPGVRVRSATEAVEAAGRIGFPVVVKPADRDRGEGVQVDLNDAAQVEAAFERARAVSSHLLVERQVSGTCHRVLVADRSVVAVIRRDPKSVHGDGEHTIRELITLANEKNEAVPEFLRQTAFPCDALAVECLQRAGLTLDSVPARGQPAPLRPIETGDWGGSPEFVTDRIHPDNIDLAVRVARLLDLGIVGLDIVSEDIAVPWHVNGAMILEANYAPQVLGLSAAPQAAIQAMLRALLPGLGRIPVRAWIGETGALDAAIAWQRSQADAGRRIHVSTHRETLGPDGPRPMVLGVDGIFERIRALMLDPDVDGIAMVVQTDELLRTGLPVDRIDEVEITDPHLFDETAPERRIHQSRVRALIALLREVSVGQ